MTPSTTGPTTSRRPRFATPSSARRSSLLGIAPPRSGHPLAAAPGDRPHRAPGRGRGAARPADRMAVRPRTRRTAGDRAGPARAAGPHHGRPAQERHHGRRRGGRGHDDAGRARLRHRPDHRQRRHHRRGPGLRRAEPGQGLPRRHLHDLRGPVGVGDVVDLGAATGTVEAVSLRVTRLRDVNGTVWYVRNGEILRVGNQSQNWARTVLDVDGRPTARTSPGCARVLRTSRTTCGDDEDFEGVIIEEPEVWGVEAVTADADHHAGHPQDRSDGAVAGGARDASADQGPLRRRGHRDGHADRRGQRGDRRRRGGRGAARADPAAARCRAGLGQ